MGVLSSLPSTPCHRPDCCLRFLSIAGRRPRNGATIWPSMAASLPRRFWFLRSRPRRSCSCCARAMPRQCGWQAGSDSCCWPSRLPTWAQSPSTSQPAWSGRRRRSPPFSAGRSPSRKFRCRPSLPPCTKRTGSPLAKRSRTVPKAAGRIARNFASRARMAACASSGQKGFGTTAREPPRLASSPSARM
jgi:hypothetical protein